MNVVCGILSVGFFNKKSREKEKTQEEMAAQIAQMIIKDCSLPQQCKDWNDPFQENVAWAF